MYLAFSTSLYTDLDRFIPGGVSNLPEGIKLLEDNNLGNFKEKGKNSTSKDNFDIANIDFISKDEKAIIKRAYDGAIDEESLVEVLLTLERKTYFICHGMQEGTKCGRSCGNPFQGIPTPNLIRFENILKCPNCGRIFNPDDFIDNKNKIVIEIGNSLAKKGGLQLMQLVANRFAARGGKAYNLSTAWHTIGGWLD